MFPPPRRPRDIYEKIPKRRRPKLPALNTTFRLIPGLEKTDPRVAFLPHVVPSFTDEGPFSDSTALPGLAGLHIVPELRYSEPRWEP